MTTEMDRVIRGGRIVTPDGIIDGDLGIRDGQIAAMGGRIEGAEVIDAGTEITSAQGQPISSSANAR